MCRVHAPCLARRPHYFSFVVGCAPQGGLRLETVVDIMRQVVAGLRHLHSLGILHRDLRAANVLVESLDPIQVNFLLLSLSLSLQRDSRVSQPHGTCLWCKMCAQVQSALGAGHLHVAPAIAKRAYVAASLGGVVSFSCCDGLVYLLGYTGSV